MSAVTIILFLAAAWFLLNSISSGANLATSVAGLQDSLPPQLKDLLGVLSQQFTAPLYVWGLIILLILWIVKR